MAKPVIISNTTPLINFAEIGRMDILHALFGDLVITPGVQGELAFQIKPSCPCVDLDRKPTKK